MKTSVNLKILTKNFAQIIKWHSSTHADECFLEINLRNYYCLYTKHFKKDTIDEIKNIKKKVANATIIVTTMDDISSEIETSASVVSIVPSIPMSRHLSFLIRHFSTLQHEVLQPVKAARISTKASDATPTLNATHIPLKMSGVSPRENSTATITPSIIPKIVPTAPHPHEQLQPKLLDVFIFINSSSSYYAFFPSLVNKALLHVKR